LRKLISVIGLAVALAFTLTACNAQSSRGQKLENQQQSQDITSILLAQPLPHFNYSQLRANLSEIETAEANGVQTTSFFYNLGVRDPVQTCASVGAPIPTTDQLSNQNQINYQHGNAVTGQMDPAGVYKGDSSGTYVICIGANGKPYADYWEGYVQTVFGPAKWNATTHSIEMIGAPTATFTKGK
jgi:hypothetical protein